MPETIKVDIAPADQVTALLYPAGASNSAGISLILGHGAGTDQRNAFLVSFATELAERGIEAVTFNFLYTEHRRRIPDRNDRLEVCYRAVIDAVRNRIGRNKLAIGGKSMGGRIASQVAAKTPLDLAGLVFLGYPLHPPGKPDQLRSKHLPSIRAPMLFVQGSRDAFGTPEELRPILDTLEAPADLFVIADGDHSFKVRKSAGTPQQDVHRAILDHVVHWLTKAGGRSA